MNNSNKSNNSNNIDNVNNITNNSSNSFKLVVKNVTPILNKEDLEILFKPFNCIGFKALNGQMKGTVFVDFQTQEDANRALNQLNGFKVHGRALRVEVSTGKKKDNGISGNNSSSNGISNNNSNKNSNININNTSQQIQSIPQHNSSGNNENSNGGNNNGSNYNISMGLAEPSQAIINEITYYLQTRPDFYSQVLNIMGLMNIQLYTKPELLQQPLYHQIQSHQKILVQEEKKNLKRNLGCGDFRINSPNSIDNQNVNSNSQEEEEEEEEWMSDDDVTKNIDPSVIEFTNKLFPSVISQRVLKKVKLSNENNSKSNSNSSNNSGNNSGNNSYGNSNNNNSNNISNSNKSDINSNNGDFNFQKSSIFEGNSVNQSSVVLSIQDKVNNNTNSSTTLQFNLNNNNETKDIISIEQINSNRCTIEELEAIVKGKLNIGEPSSKIYIKNISKHVKVNDFESLFRRLFNSAEEMKSNLQIDYHTSGRLHGQAFIQFPSLQLATQALEESQGYKFHQKPIIISFSKNKSN